MNLLFLSQFGFDKSLNSIYKLLALIEGKNPDCLLRENDIDNVNSGNLCLMLFFDIESRFE